MPTINELRAKRAGIIQNARDAYMPLAAPTAEQTATFDAAMTEQAAVADQIKRMEQARELEAELAGQAYQAGVSVDKVVAGKELEKRLLIAFVTNNMGRLSDADRGEMKRRMDIANAASVGTSTAGGYTVAPDWMAELLIAQKAFGGMRAAARVVSTETGVDLPWPSMDDTSNVATIVGENTAGAAGADLVFSTRTLKAWTYRSGYLPISIELLQDSAFDFDTLVRDALAIRFARGQNAHFTTGNGTSQPQGIIIGAALGTTGTTGQTGTVIFDDFIELQHSIDPAYRRNCKFMMNDATLKVVRKLKDTQGRPLWLPGIDGLAGTTPDTILGTPLIINQDMPTMAANAKSILYGDFSNYIIRDVMGLSVRRLDERFAENGQVAFIAFQRTDGRLVSAGSPVKWYANSAT